MCVVSVKNMRGLKNSCTLAVEEGMEKAKQYMGDTLYDRGLEEIENMTVAKMALGDFQNKIFGGVFVSLLIAAFLRRSKPLFEEPAQ